MGCPLPLGGLYWAPVLDSCDGIGGKAAVSCRGSMRDQLVMDRGAGEQFPRISRAERLARVTHGHGVDLVEVVISALRRKLGDSAGNLQTVRGAGYRFTAPP